MGYNRRAQFTVRPFSGPASLPRNASVLTNMYAFAMENYGMHPEELPIDSSPNGELLNNLFNAGVRTDYGKFDIERCILSLSKNHPGLIFSVAWIGEDGRICINHCLNGQGYLDTVKVPSFSSTKLARARTTQKRAARDAALERIALANKKNAALAKLSDEERKLLGL